MRIDILHSGKSLKRIAHKGQVYVKAPKKGSYTLQVYNSCSRKRLAVITVDGINVITGKDGTPVDEGYVLRPWETLEIPGWRRSDGTVAAFTFRPEEKSYANKTGRGTSNVGVVGMAVFEEAVPVLTTTGYHITPYWTVKSIPACTVTSTTTTTVVTDGPAQTFSTAHTNAVGTAESAYSAGIKAPSRGVLRSAKPKMRRRKVTEDVGTGYGKELEFHTTDTVFNRATPTIPAEMVSLFYATKERLLSWGVPVEDMRRSERPQPFPSTPSVPAPPGWRG